MPMTIPTIQHKGLSFINLTKPSQEEIEFLHKQFGFSMLNLEDYLYKTQIPKIEMYKAYSLVVLDVPFIQQTDRKKESSSRFSMPPNVLTNKTSQPQFSAAPRNKRIMVGEVNFFIGKDYVVVLHDEKTPQIDDLFQLCVNEPKRKDELMGKGSVYLFYRIADVLVDASFPYVEDITNTIDYIDRRLEENSSASVIEDISMTRRNIVVFETMMKPALTIFADLEKGKYNKFNDNMMQYWSNILDHIQKISERLEDNKELIHGIAASHESILSKRSNDLVKFLTVITSISFPFVIVNNLYSMNVEGLPFADQPWIVSILFLGIFIGGVSIVAYFKYRDWL